MGWNDHDDRLMMISEELEDAGMPYEQAYMTALDIRVEEMATGEYTSAEYILAIAEDFADGEWVRGMSL